VLQALVDLARVEVQVVLFDDVRDVALYPIG
jgi:hypothetical protein